MGEWLGLLGGLMMVLLVLLFALLLLCEAGVLRITRQAVLREYGLFMGCVGLGVALQLTGGLFRYLATSDVQSVLEPAALWQRTGTAVLLPMLESDASVWDLCSLGCFPLATAAHRLFGGLLLGSYHQAAMYLGLLCGGFSLWSASRTGQGGLLCSCLPGVVLMTLPGSFAPIMACLWAG